jgi:hypothetical protein
MKYEELINVLKKENKNKVRKYLSKKLPLTLLLTRNSKKCYKIVTLESMNNRVYEQLLVALHSKATQHISEILP